MASRGFTPDSSSGRDALGGGRPALDHPSIELITAAQKLWSLRRRGLLSPDEHDVALFALESRYGLDVSPCGRCGIRHAQAWVDGLSLCRHCRLGDEIDEGWEAYRDATA